MSNDKDGLSLEGVTGFGLEALFNDNNHKPDMRTVMHKCGGSSTEGSPI